jgi:hypothetical protein
MSLQLSFNEGAGNPACALKLWTAAGARLAPRYAERKMWRGVEMLGF